MVGIPKTHPVSTETGGKMVLTINESVLAFAILNNKESNAVDYKIEADGSRLLNSVKSQAEWSALVNRFKNDPKDCLAVARNAVGNILKDDRLSEIDKKLRLERYVDAYFDLSLKLDKAAFPVRGVQEGVPEYIPHGLVDMGSDRDDLPNRNGGREMIHVDKRKIYLQFRDFLIKMFLYGYEDMSSTFSKRSVIEEIGKIVYRNMPYHKLSNPFGNFSGMVELSDTYNNGLSVCRHHALYAQVLLQFCGIKSLLLKCDVNFGRGTEPHVANLIRINSKWYLADFTNPDIIDVQNNKGKVFLREVDLPNDGPEYGKEYSWTFSVANRPQGAHPYRLRRNMFSKII
jgi:hypothetical protein